MIETLLRRHLGGYCADSILDVGPGYSEFAVLVAEITGAHRVMSLDCDGEVLGWQEQLLKRKGIESENLLVMLDPDGLKAISQRFASKRFDIILCQEVLEHLPEAQLTLSALAELISENGRIVVTVPTGKSEHWLRLINPSYMRKGAHRHVQEFSKRELQCLLKRAGLQPLVFVQTQPHYFISHTWLFGTRMQIEESTGRVITGGFRASIWHWLNFHLSGFFGNFCPAFWGWLIPRNYFVIAARLNR